MGSKEQLIRIGDKYWTLEKRVCSGTGQGPEGECPDTPEEIVKWQEGPKVRRWDELLQFRGFRVWVSFTEKDHPELFECLENGEPLIPGMIEEFILPNKAKYTFAGVVNVQLKIERIASDDAPPLYPEEIKAAGEVVDILEGRAIKGDAVGGGLDTENNRLLHRINRKVDGVPSMVAEQGERNKTLAAGAAELHRRVGLTSKQWETYRAHWVVGKTQTAIAKERGLSKKEIYKINRECKAIEKAFADAGVAIPPKLTRNNAELGPDGTVYRKEKKA